MNRTFDLLADLLACNLQVVLRLQVLPELRTRSEVPRQPQCHLRRDRPPPSHYFIDRWRGHTEFLRHLVRAQFQRPHEIVEQDIPGMYGPESLSCHGIYSLLKCAE